MLLDEKRMNCSTREKNRRGYKGREKKSREQQRKNIMVIMGREATLDWGGLSTHNYHSNIGYAGKETKRRDEQRKR